MRAAGVAIAIALGGCDLVFAIHVPPDGSGSGGGRIVIPPDGATSCQPPPAFEQFVFAPTQLPAITGTGGDTPSHVEFFTADDGVHALMTPISFAGLWEARLGDAAAHPIGDLGGNFPPFYGVLSDGAAFWYDEPSTHHPFVALPAGGDTWTLQRTELGFPDAFLTLPSGPAYHDGTVRMIADVHDTMDTRRWVEISSSDGVVWNTLDTFQLPVEAGTLIDLSLSPDGCFLLFVHFGAGSVHEVSVSARDPDDRFTTFTEIASATNVASFNALSPVVTPDLDAMYVIDGTGKTVYRGVRP
jgi:hypothetical protein